MTTYLTISASADVWFEYVIVVVCGCSGCFGLDCRSLLNFLQSFLFVLISSMVSLLLSILCFVLLFEFGCTLLLYTVQKYTFYLWWCVAFAAMETAAIVLVYLCDVGVSRLQCWFVWFSWCYIFYFYPNAIVFAMVLVYAHFNNITTIGCSHSRYAHTICGATSHTEIHKRFAK